MKTPHKNANEFGIDFEKISFTDKWSLLMFSIMFAMWPKECQEVMDRIDVRQLSRETVEQLEEDEK